MLLHYAFSLGRQSGSSDGGFDRDEPRGEDCAGAADTQGASVATRLGLVRPQFGLHKTCCGPCADELDLEYTNSTRSQKAMTVAGEGNPGDRLGSMLRRFLDFP